MIINNSSVSSLQKFQFNGINLSVDLVSEEATVSNKSLEIFKSCIPTEEEVPTPFNYEAATLKEKIASIKELEQQLQEATDNRTQEIALAALFLTLSLLVVVAGFVGMVAITVLAPVSIPFIGAMLGFSFGLATGLAMTCFEGVPSLEQALHRKERLESTLKRQKNDFNEHMWRLKQINEENFASNYDFYVRRENEITDALSEKIKEIKETLHNSTARERVKELQSDLKAHERAQEQFAQQAKFYKRFSTNQRIPLPSAPPEEGAAA